MRVQSVARFIINSLKNSTVFCYKLPVGNDGCFFCSCLFILS